MTDKEIQASDEEMEQFNIFQNEKCVSAKEEKLNDLKNKISLALKDVILQQGFKIICKRLTELKKENEELKQSKNALTIQYEWDISELKAQNKDLCESLDIMNNRESELLDQIEKMKCCGNCKYRNNYNFPTLEEPCKKCLNYSKWELAE